MFKRSQPYPSTRKVRSSRPLRQRLIIDALNEKVKCVGMDSNQARIIELLREVHLIAFKEMERLNLRIAELENQNRQQLETINKPAVRLPAVDPTRTSTSSLSKQPAEMLNDMQVADYLNMSVSTLRRWRLFRKGPKFVKIGSAVRYKRGDVESWVDSLPGTAMTVKVDNLSLSRCEKLI